MILKNEKKNSFVQESVLDINNDIKEKEKEKKPQIELTNVNEEEDDEDSLKFIEAPIIKDIDNPESLTNKFKLGIVTSFVKNTEEVSKE